MLAFLQTSRGCARLCLVVVKKDGWTIPRLQRILNPNIHGKRRFILPLHQVNTAIRAETDEYVLLAQADLLLAFMDQGSQNWVELDLLVIIFR